MNRWESSRYDQQQPAPDPGKATAGGRWVHRDADIHRCPKPGYSPSVKQGDRWECGTCHKQWTVAKVEHHHDPRPGESYSTLQWSEYHAHRGSNIYDR